MINCTRWNSSKLIFIENTKFLHVILHVTRINLQKNSLSFLRFIIITREKIFCHLNLNLKTRKRQRFLKKKKKKRDSRKFKDSSLIIFHSICIPSFHPFRETFEKKKFLDTYDFLERVIRNLWRPGEGGGQANFFNRTWNLSRSL